MGIVWYYLIFQRIFLLVKEFRFQEIYKEIEKLYDMLVEFLDENYLDVEMIDIKLVLEVTFKVLLIKKYQIIIKRVIKKANYEQSTFILIIYQFYQKDLQKTIESI